MTPHPDGCDRCGRVAELYHNDRFGGSLCERCDTFVNDEPLAPPMPPLDLGAALASMTDGLRRDFWRAAITGLPARTCIQVTRVTDRGRIIDHARYLGVSYTDLLVQHMGLDESWPLDAIVNIVTIPDPEGESH